jgi:glycosyltransferase involved in cell wall biosynthesis
MRRGKAATSPPQWQQPDRPGSARVSATLIVRDESRFIEDCLQSLVGVVDEIVVVDTGSSDDTIEKACRFPVELSHFAWCGDFSAARNFAIGQATGDWILYIDADERLQVPSRRAFDDTVDDVGALGWQLRLHPRVGWTAYGELRLFRRDPRIRFRGIIHERVHESVEAACRTDGRRIGLCDWVIQHVGYEGDQAHKTRRNIPLLRAYLDAEPSRVYCWWHLGEMLRLTGDSPGAEEAWERGIDAVRTQRRHDTAHGDSPPFVSLITLRHERGADVDELLREALELFPGHRALQWIAAKLAIEGNRLDAARPTLQALAAIDADTFYDPDIAYDRALFSHLAREALALCEFRAGRFEDAARHYRLAAAAAADPGPCEVKARLAESRAARNRRL